MNPSTTAIITATEYTNGTFLHVEISLSSLSNTKLLLTDSLTLDHDFRDVSVVYGF